MADAVQVLQHVTHGRTSFPPTLLERLTERPDTRGLSTRQMEVLEELARGRSNDEIARRLFISTNTVKFHLRAIYDRLGVHNRVEAAQLRPGNGSSEPPPERVETGHPAGLSRPPARAIPPPVRAA